MKITLTFLDEQDKEVINLPSLRDISNFFHDSTILSSNIPLFMLYLVGKYSRFTHADMEYYLYKTHFNNESQELFIHYKPVQKKR